MQGRQAKFIFILLLIVGIVHFIFRAYAYKDNYLVKYDQKYWEHRYMISQWVVPNSKNGIGDDGLYAYAGYKYVHDGLSPILNSPEVPPLGKYLIGLTIVVFQNQNIFGLITAVSALILFYLLNLHLFKVKLFAFIPVFLFSFEPLFWEQMQASYLDLLQLSFLFVIFLFVLKQKYFFASIVIGLFSATKFPFMSVLIVGCILLYIFLQKRSDLKKMLLALIAWPIVYSLTYFRFFMLHNSLIDFLKVLKYVFNFYLTGAKSNNHLSIFSMLLTGKWQTWWDGVMNVHEWNIAWPVVSVISLGVIVKKIRKNGPFSLIIIWILSYLAFLIIIPVYPRYLLLFLPFLYNLVIWVLSESSVTKSWLRLE